MGTLNQGEADTTKVTLTFSSESGVEIHGGFVEPDEESGTVLHLEFVKPDQETLGMLDFFHEVLDVECVDLIPNPNTTFILVAPRMCVYREVSCTCVYVWPTCGDDSLTLVFRFGAKQKYYHVIRKMEKFTKSLKAARLLPEGG